MIDTQVEYRIDAGLRARPPTARRSRRMKVETAGTMFALYPHQWKYTTTKLTGLTYGSVRGTMKVAVGEAFATEVPIQGVLPMFPAEGVQDGLAHARILAGRGWQEAPRGIRRHLLGRQVSRPLGHAQRHRRGAGDAALQQVFVDEIKRRLENWFTAAPGKDQPVFYYNATWNTLIGSRPSYGSDSSAERPSFPLRLLHPRRGRSGPPRPRLGREVGADGEHAHPRHRLARPQRPAVPLYAVLRQVRRPFLGLGRRQLCRRQQPGVLVRIDERLVWHDPVGPGHRRHDGPRHGPVPLQHRTDRRGGVLVRRLGHELSARTIPNVALGMVWGGKGAFGTWFSGDIDCIHGINWLPFTPASIYMGRVPDYVKKNHDRIVEKRKGGRDYNTGWGDLVVMFYALSDPAAAAQYIDAHPDCKLEGGNSHAFMYHWIYTLNNLGRNDAGVTADYPICERLQQGRTSRPMRSTITRQRP